MTHRALFPVLLAVLTACGNRPPVAVAGADRTVATGATVALDGSASSDPDGDLLAFEWALSSRPAGSAAALVGATTSAPTFVADVDGAYVVSLVVSDQKAASAPDEVVVTARSANRPPVANAGTDRDARVGVAVALAGSGTDADGDPLTYRWGFSGRPDGSAAALSSATVAAPVFVPDVAGAYTLALVVNDGTADSAADEVIVTARANHAPVAHAGPDQTVSSGATVLLGGDGSSDADGDALAYSWTLSSRPDGSAAALSSATDEAPSFVADVAGPYVVALVVNDGFADSATDEVIVTAQGSWKGARQVGSGDLLALAPAGEGRAHAVWRDGATLRTSRYDPATDAWTAPLGLDTDTSGLGDSKIGASPAGHAIAVWVHYEPAGNGVRGSVFHPGTGTWDAYTDVGPQTAGVTPGRPSVAVDATGRAVAVWEQYDSDATYNLWANVYVPASGWGTAQRIETDSGSSVQGQVAFDGTGRAVAVWITDVGGRYRLRSNVYDFQAGAWAGQQDIDPAPAADTSLEAALATDADGAVVMVFLHQDGAGSAPDSIWFLRRDPATGAWDGATDVDGTTDISCYNHRLAVDAAGNRTVVFGRYRDGAMDVWVNRWSASTGAWEGATAVESDDLNAMNPAVATDPAGNAVLSWMQYNGQSFDLNVRRRGAAAGAWGPATKVAVLPNYETSPALVVAGPERALLVWAMGGVWSSTLK